MDTHKLIFIGGLHRSGTSILHECLLRHPMISGFADTGVPEDEGQHLQTVLLPDTLLRVYRLTGSLGRAGRVLTFMGGAGRFGFLPRMHLTERSRYACPDNAEKLLLQWSEHWDMTKPFLVEKSPPNMLRTRLLHALFPTSSFLIIMRHPIPVSLSTKAFRRTPLTLHALFRHWLLCHATLEDDLNYVDARCAIIKYEDFANHPEHVLSGVYSALDIPQMTLQTEVIANTNDKHYAKWRELKRRSSWHASYVRYLETRFEDAFNRFGYSIREEGCTIAAGDKRGLGVGDV